MFEASCHCGEVVLKTKNPPDSLTNCNCSICNRLGAVWGYYSADTVEVKLGNSGSKYSWGKKNIIYHSCSVCSCTTHYTAVGNEGGRRLAINTRMASVSSTKNIPVRYFDGADTWAYLDE